MRSFFYRSDGLRSIVHTAQGFQVRIVEALHTDRQTSHTRSTKRFEAVFLKGARIGFE